MSRSPPLPLHQRSLSTSTAPSSSFHRSPTQGHSRNLSLNNQPSQNPFDERVVGNSYAGWDSPRPAPRPPSPSSEYSFDNDTDPDPGAVTPEDLDRYSPRPLSPPPRSGSRTTWNQQQGRDFGSAQGYRAPDHESGPGYSYYGDNALPSPSSTGSVGRVASRRDRGFEAAAPAAAGLDTAAAGIGGHDNLDQWNGSSQGMYDNYGFHNSDNYNRSSAATSGLEKARDFEVPYEQHKTICGLRRRVFWMVLAVILLIVAAAVGIGIGVGVGIKQNNNSPTNTSSSDSHNAADMDGAASTSTQSSLGTSGTATVTSSATSSHTTLVVARPSDSSKLLSATARTTSRSSLSSTHSSQSSTTSTSSSQSSATSGSQTSTSSSASSTSESNKAMAAATIASKSSNTASATTSSASSTAAATASAIPSVSCPNDSGNMYSTNGSNFQVLCGVDYSGAGVATDLGNTWTSSFEKCIVTCAQDAGCTACGWGALPGDNNGDNHRCWLKKGVDPGKGAVAHAGWQFAVLNTAAAPA